MLAQLSDTILEVDRVIMPVHLGNHWTCAVIDLAAKELVYHDSMGVGPSLIDNNVHDQRVLATSSWGQFSVVMGCKGKGTVFVSLVLHSCANFMANADAVWCSWSIPLSQLSVPGCRVGTWR